MTDRRNESPRLAGQSGSSCFVSTLPKNFMRRTFLPIAVILVVLTHFAGSALGSETADRLNIDRLFDDDFLDELFAPIHHTHFSENGTPYIHPFTFEPPQIHQDVFFIFKYAENTLDGSDEYETEFHIDWALTKRLGILFAVPKVGNHQADGTQNVGIGDLEIAPRVMWIEDDTFILATNLFITAPTGDETRDLGAGEATISPLITTWHDLGNWNSLLINFGPEYGMRSGDKSMVYGFSIAHTWLGHSILNSESHDDHDHGEHEGHAAHFVPGMQTIYLEMAGETQLNGEKQTMIALLPGYSYVLAESAELRFGVLLPVSETKRFDRQYFASFTWIY